MPSAPEVNNLKDSTGEIVGRTTIVKSGDTYTWMVRGLNKAHGIIEIGTEKTLKAAKLAANEKAKEVLGL